MILNRPTFVAMAAAALLALATYPTSAADNPFAALDGAWGGSGSVRLDTGKTERLKCKGYYNVKGGSALGMAINCANPSFKINMRASLTSANGRISGSWEEREFNQVGTVSGKVTDKGMALNFSGAITGSMSIVMEGTGQTVTISTGGPGFIGANLQFAKMS